MQDSLKSKDSIHNEEMEKARRAKEHRVQAKLRLESLMK